MSRFIIVFSHLPILITLICVVFYFKRLKKEIQIFSYFVIVSFVIQYCSLGLWFYSINNMPLLHIYIPLGFCLLGWFYEKILRGMVNSKIILAITIAFILFCIINSLFLQDIFTFCSYAMTVQSILIVIFSIFTYIFLLNKIVKQNSDLDITSLNWINSGFFVYHSSNLLIFYFGESILSVLNANAGLTLWIFHSFLSIIMYVFFIVGLIKAQKQ